MSTSSNPVSGSDAVRGPLVVSTANPRYFTVASDERKAVYLTGSHIWNNLHDGMGPGAVCADTSEQFDYGAYLDFLAEHGHNFIRLWRWEQFKSQAAGGDFHLCMTPQPWARTGPGEAKDGKPRFDLDRFDEAFFDRLRDRVVAAGQRGIYVAVMFFDGWALHLSPAPDHVEGHPLHAANNVNGVGIGSIVDYQVVTPRQVWRSPLVACLAAKPVDRRNGLVRLSPVGAKVQIRPGSDAELPALVEALGERPFFADRLARQHKGRGVLLVAWLGDRPVGDVYLMREPADVPKVRRYLPGVPQLDHLEVVGPLQRRGIGTALIHAGEDTARRLGDQQLALGVGLANVDARRLFERLGYVDWGHGPVVGTWRAVRDDGTAVAVSQLIDMLVKHL